MTRTSAPSSKQDTNLTAAAQTAEALLQVPGEAAKGRYFTLTRGIRTVEAAAEEKVRFPAQIAQDKLAIKSASAVLVSVNAGTLALLSLERPDAHLKVSMQSLDDPGATARLLQEILGEVKTKLSQAMALGVRRALGHFEACNQALAATLEAQVEAGKKALTSMFHLKALTAECNVFIVEQTPEDHPSRTALKRKMRARAPKDPKALAQVELTREEEKAKLKQLKADAKAALDKARAESKEHLKAQVKQVKQVKAPAKATEPATRPSPERAPGVAPAEKVAA